MYIQNIVKFFLLALIICPVQSKAQLLKYGENVTLKSNVISSDECLVVNMENYRSDTLFFTFSIFSSKWRQPVRIHSIFGQSRNFI